jgi:outer membrane biosynthesis protein TonB
MSRLRTTIISLVTFFAVFSFAQDSAQKSAAAPPETQSHPPQHLKARVSTGIMLGLVEHKTMPIYPEDAMKRGIQGDTVFKIAVDETGKITDIVPLEGDPLLLDASKDALQTFRFRPYLLNGTPVVMESQLGFHFSVDKTADTVNGHVECMASIPSRP